MNIGIDGNEANIKHRVGSNIYAFEVIKQLAHIDSADSYKIYLRDQPLNDFPAENKNWHYQVFGPGKFWTQFALPVKLYLEKHKPDVFFTPGHYAPRFCPIPSVISILDTSYFLFPEYFRKSDLYQLKSWSAYSIKKAEKIITISQSTKKDLQRYYRVKESKIKVIYPGFDNRRFDPGSLSAGGEQILKKYHLKKPYLLFVGTIQPRKNILRLISAFRIIRLKYPDLHLVIAGKAGWLFDPVYKEATHKSPEIIQTTGYVEDNDLPYLYQNALCYVLPSLYEGFGIPVLEAMSMNCPVVVSNTSSLPEVAGDAGILIDPYSIPSLVNGLEKALSLNREEKESMIKKGREQVKKFSWEKCGKEILSVLNEYSR